MATRIEGEVNWLIKAVIVLFIVALAGAAFWGNYVIRKNAYRDAIIEADKVREHRHGLD